MVHRALMCLLIAMTMLVYSLQLLPFQGGSTERIFAWSWLLFALIVIMGNGLTVLSRRRKRVEIRAGQRVRPRSQMRG